MKIENCSDTEYKITKDDGDWFVLNKSIVEGIAMTFPHARVRMDIAAIAKGHTDLSSRFNDMVTMFKENTNAVGALQNRIDCGDQEARYQIIQLKNKLGEIEESPGNYRNSKDIEKLKARIDQHEQLSYKQQDVDELFGRVKELEKLLQSGKNVTVHSRLNDLEVSLKENREMHNAHFKAHQESMGQISDDLKFQIREMKECCKNTVAAGKALEDKVTNLERQYGDTLKYVRDTTGNLREKIRDVLRSL